MIEFEDNEVTVKRSLTDDILNFMIRLLITISECARLALCFNGVCTLVERFLCERRKAVANRTVATQSQCTYTSLKGAVTPRFFLVPADEQGATVARRTV